MSIERPRVLHIIDTLGFGGAELGLARIVERTAHRFEHSVLCIREGGRTAQLIEAQQVPLLKLHKPNGTQWHLPLRIAQVCRSLRPHVVHTRNWGTMDAVIGARLARVPVVVHAEHGFSIGDVLGAHRYRRWLQRILFAGIDRVVAVSEHLRNLLLDEIGIQPSKVVLIRDGIDVGRFQGHADRAALRGRLGYGPNDFVIGSVGRLDPVKNFSALIDAMAALVPRRSDARLMIAGDGPDEDNLRRQVQQLGLDKQIALLGYREDISDLLNAMDLFVLPSLAEGTCNAILEAMAVGLPVVATRVAGNPELVLHDQTGWLVPPRDVRALAERIEYYANNPVLGRQHGLAGREHVLRQYTAEQMVDAYADLYRGELARRTRAAQQVPAPTTNRTQV